MRTAAAHNQRPADFGRQPTERVLVRMASAATADPEGGAAAARIATLTTRERETIAAFSSDAAAPAKVIASRLFISEHTLRNHLTSIYGKLGVANRVDLYAFATRHSLNRPDQASGAGQRTTGAEQARQ